MNKIRYATVCFWMNIFDSFFSIGDVQGFKKLLLKNEGKGDLDTETTMLILEIYGLKNTDIFKPTVQEEKIYMLQTLLAMFNTYYEHDRPEECIKALQNVKSMKMGKTVESLLYRILGSNTDIV